MLCATTEASGAERCFVCGKEGESLVVHHDHFGEFCESLFWSHLWEQSAAEDRVKDAAYQEWRRLRDLAKSLFVLDQFRLCNEELGTLTVEDFKPEAARKRAPAPTQVRKPEPAPVARVASEISEA